MIHYAKLVSEEGRVSPLCAESPQPVESKEWTVRLHEVTCRQCREKLQRLGRVKPEFVPGTFNR